MDLNKVRDGINYISNGSVRVVLENLCDELEGFELDRLAFENEYVAGHLDPGIKKGKKQIKKVVESYAEKEGSTE
jgi:hypothetical protein